MKEEKKNKKRGKVYNIENKIYVHELKNIFKNY